jgi:acetyl-CoA synthetase
MDWPVIHKNPARAALAPNLADYDAVCRDFSWEAARAGLDGLPGGGLNIAYEALDRDVAKGKGGKLAIRWLGLEHAFLIDGAEKERPIITRAAAIWTRAS